MGNFTVDTKELTTAASDFKSISAKIDEIMNQADETMDICKKSFLGRLADSIQDAILLSGMKNNIKDLNNLSKCLKEAAEIYQKHEKRVEQYSFRDDPDIIKYIDNGGEGYMQYNYYSEFSSKRNIYKDALTIVGNNLTDLSYYTGQYGEKIIYNSLASILAGLTETEGPDLSLMELPEELIKSATDGKDFMEKITNKKLFPQYADDFELLGEIAGELDWAQFTAEEVAFILKDYTANMAYIKALESALVSSGEGSEELKSAINKLKRDYTTKFTKVVDDLAEKVIEKGWNAAVDISTGGVFGVVEFAAGVVYTATGLDKEAENLEMLTGINNYKHDLNRAYNAKAEQIKSGNYTQADVEELEKLHNLSKATTEKEYELMYELTDDKEDKKYIEKELDEIRSTPSF